MMLFQVISKPPFEPSRWEFYPCWWPTEDEEEARWWAQECLSEGCEAVMLRASTIPRLEQIGKLLVEEQDDTLLPRWWRMSSEEQLTPAPDEQSGRQARRDGRGAPGRWTGAPARGRDVVGRTHVPAYTFSATRDEPEDERDMARWRIEQGTGGDVDAEGRLWRHHPHFPERMDVLHAWIALSERTQRGELGGAEDGHARALARAG
jgi:hypothetical protein